MIASLLLALTVTTSAATPCTVKAQPKLSLAPLMTMVVTATIEPGGHDPETIWRQADLILVYQGIELTSSRLWEGDSALKAPRTSKVWWKDLGLPAGEYMVALVVQSLKGRCMASDKLTVHGAEP